MKYVTCFHFRAACSDSSHNGCNSHPPPPMRLKTDDIPLPDARNLRQLQSLILPCLSTEAVKLLNNGKMWTDNEVAEENPFKEPKQETSSQSCACGSGYRFGQSTQLHTTTVLSRVVVQELLSPPFNTCNFGDVSSIIRKLVAW